VFFVAGVVVGACLLFAIVFLVIALLLKRRSKGAGVLEEKSVYDVAPVDETTAYAYKVVVVVVNSTNISDSAVAGKVSVASGSEGFYFILKSIDRLTPLFKSLIMQCLNR
jgi:hypothetical protein